MKHHVRTIVKTIKPGQVETLREALKMRGDEVQNGNDTRFSDIPGLHFLSCCILDERKEPRQSSPKLVVELSFEGDVSTFFKWVVENRRPALDELLSSCILYPGAGASPKKVLNYLLERTPEQAVYLGTPGRSLEQIKEETGLRERVAQELDQTRDLAITRAERWIRVATAIHKESPALHRVPKRPWRVRLNPADLRVRKHVYAIAWFALLLLAWLAGVSAAMYWGQTGRARALVIALPLAAGVAATWFYIRDSPNRLALRARIRIWRAALGEGVRAVLYVAPVGGLLLASVKLLSDRAMVATGVIWLFEALLAFYTLVTIAALAFTLSGRLSAFVASLSAGAFLVRYPQYLLWAFPLTVAITLALLVAFAIAIRKCEAASVVWDEQEDLAHLALVTRREYQQLHAHLASETVVDAGRFRMWTLGAVLRWVHLAAHFWYNLGHLDTITSIHFARFIILKDRRTLVFLSNYDDRFEDYLGDFSTVVGVTAVWGNTRGFPRPFLLTYDGARAENLFKRYARASQVESLIWYTAYKDLSVAEIDRATLLRESLARPIDRGESGILATVRRLLTPSLDEDALVVLMDGF